MLKNNTFNIFAYTFELVTPFALSNVQDKSTITVVVDQTIYSSQKLSLRAFSSTKSIFIQSSSLKSYLEATVPETLVLDFANLSPPAPLKKGNSKTEKIEGEKEIIIGMTVKKEDNFPKWYEQVLV